MTDVDIPSLPIIHLVFAYREFIPDKNQIAYQWFLVDLDGEQTTLTQQSFYFVPKKKSDGNLVRYASPGMIYSFPSPNDGKTVYSGYAKYIRQFPDQKQNQTWSAMDRNAQAHQAAEVLKIKQAKTQPVDEAVAILNRAYWQIPAPQRKGYLIWLSAEVAKQIRK